MHQPIPSPPPGHPPEVLHLLSARDLYHINCPGVGPMIYYQSTKLSINAAWRHFSASNWSTIYCFSLVTKSVSKLRESFKTLSIVLKLKLEGITKEWLNSLPVLFKVCFLQNFKISTPINRRSWLDLSKYFLTVGVFLSLHGAVLLQKNFALG